MISVFATGDFIRVDVPDWYNIGRVGLLMGFALIPARSEADQHHLVGIVCGQDGDISLVAASDMKADFRYDAERDRFIDQSAIDHMDAEGASPDMGGGELPSV